MANNGSERDSLITQSAARRLTRRTFLSASSKVGLALPLASALAVSASARTSAGPASGPSLSGAKLQGDGNAVVAAIPQKTLNLDPALAGADGYGDIIPMSGNLTEGLTRFKIGSVEVEPALAEKWDVSADGRTYVFHIRPSVTFHDGTPLDAKAVEFNFLRQLDPNNPYHYPGITYAEIVFAEVSSVKATGPLELTIVLKRPIVMLLGNLAIFAAGIISPTALQKYGKDFSSHAAATGPFKLDHWTKDVELVYTANSDYWGGRPALDRLVWQTIPDDTVRLSSLKTGSIDIAGQIDFKDVKSVKDNPSLQAATGNFLNTQFLAFNQKLPPFDNPQVRQAVQYAINKQNIAQAVFYGNYMVGAGPVAPGLLGYDKTLADMYPHDPEKAKSLIKNAKPSQTTFDLYNRTNSFWPLIGQLIQSDLAAIGLKANLKSLEDADFFAQLNTGKVPAFINDWTWDNGDPDNIMYSLFTAPRAVSRMGYQNAQVNNLNVQAQVEHDSTKRGQLYDQAQQLIMQDAIMVVLGYPGRIIGAKNTIQNLKVDPTGSMVLREISVK